jgi:tRNA 5-methylaminomethyl-2-thiouridine biosynthesis bifunctional protein
MSPAAVTELVRRFLARTQARPDPARPAALLLLGLANLGSMGRLLCELPAEGQALPGAERPARIDVVVIDAGVPAAATVQEAWEPAFRASTSLRAATPWQDWPSALPGLHRVRLAPAGQRDAGPLRLTLAVGSPERILPRLALAADLIVFHDDDADAGLALPLSFGGAALALARLLAPGGRLITRADDTRREAWLRRGNWTPDGEQGSDRPPAARGTPCARWQPWQPGRALGRVTPASPTPPAANARELAVVGAGLAGLACAAVFASRGWQVTLIDASPLPQPGSGQPLLADHLHLSPDDNPTARLSRQALWLSRPWRAGAPIGRFQMADTETVRVDQLRALAALGPAADTLAMAVNRFEASDLAGVQVARGGLWLPGCGVSAPADLHRHWISGNPAIRVISGTRVHSLHRENGHWLLSDERTSPIARAPAVILANAADAPRLAGLASVRLQARQGRAVALASPALRGLRSVLGGSAYACPMGEDTALIGLTDLPAQGPDLSRLTGMLPALGTAAAAPRTLRIFEGWRHAAPDRLPLIGPVPDETAIRRTADDFARNDRLAMPLLPGLYLHAALGARGLLWSTLGAELLADLVEGCAPPLEADLIHALAPQRFLRQALRRGRLR